MQRRSASAVSALAAAVFAVLVAAAAAPALLPLFPGGELLREGDFAPRTLTAQRAAQYEARALTEAAREVAASNVEPVYLPPDASVRLQQGDRLGKLIDQVRLIRGRTNLSSAQQAEEVGKLPFAETLSLAGRANLIFLDRSAYESVTQQAQSVLGKILDGGVREGREPVAVRDYLGQPGVAPSSGLELTVLTELLNAFVVPNVRVDVPATEARQAAARDAVVPVVASYSPGQVVVTEGEVLTADDIEGLRATGVIEDGFDFADAAAGGLAAAGYGLALGFAAWSLQPFGRPAGRRLLLVGVAAAGAVVASRLALPEVLPGDEGRFLAYAVPVATAAMLAAAVGSFGFGAFVAFATALLVAFMATTMTEIPGASFGGATEALRLATAYGAGGVAGAAAMAGAERMRRVAFAAVAVAGATGVTLAVFWLLSVTRSTGELGWIALASGANGVAASVVATGLFVLLSLVLGIPTRMQLFELVQAEHPLLRRLQDEAPGTYHHSLMVGTLAERAAASVGADALLAKAGAYYHDIGKLAHPDYFIENMADPHRSPHRDLEPAESAAVIRAHVSDGLALAQRARLPEAVRDFIPQHHGTRLVTYFYRQATQDGAALDLRDYRYPGPRPSTVEAAIVMLADSCEAVVRSSPDQRSFQIDEIVDAVIAERLAEGQFDECNITLRDLQTVGRTFKATLRAVYHPRIEYPQPTPEELAAIVGADPS